MKKYCVIGTDKRSLNLRKMYRDRGEVIVSFDMADVVIAPIPFSRDGVKISGEIISCDELIECLAGTDKIVYSGAISDELKEKFAKNSVKFFDLLDIESVAILNAIPTAEGAISTAIEATSHTIHGSNILVMGYGRIGKVLSKMLMGMGANVFCEARNQKDIALIRALGYNGISLENIEEYLPNFDIIFNTIPIQLLTKDRLKLVKNTCTIIDLASPPGGVELDAAKSLGLNIIWALALPSKVAPYSAAIYLKDTIDFLEKRKGNI
ncbi:MAG: dipicolinate synthase subunit DpsA [Clostridia bacterium]